MLTPRVLYLQRRPVRLRGLGQSQTCIDNPDGSQTCFPSTGVDTSPVGGGIPCQSDDSGGLVAGQVYCSSGGLVPSSAGANLPSLNTPTAQSGGAINWTSIIQGAIQGTSKAVAQQTNPFAPKNLPPGTSYQITPYGTTVMTAGSTPIGTALTTANLGSMLPILLIGGGLVMVMMMARR